MGLINTINRLNDQFPKVLYHIILKPGYSESFNKQIGRIWANPVSADNPSRGFYASSDYINNNILNILSDEIKGDIVSINDISKRMGYLFAIAIFGGHCIPKDAEYVLSEKDGRLCVTLLDFGLFQPIDFSMTLQNELLSDDTKKEKRRVMLDETIRFLCEDVMIFELYFPDRDTQEFIPFITVFAEVANSIIS